MNESFTSEIFISPCFNLWNRGDGIGEISIYNHIIAYIHGENEYIPNYYWDEELGNYNTKEDQEFEPVSCFPGYLQTSDERLIHLNSLFIESQEHLISLLDSIKNLPEKPKGSIFDVFSQSEKFLMSLNFDFDVLSKGHDIDSLILNNFNAFSQYLFDFTSNYPEISVSFIKHSYLNGNIYFHYLINDKYNLHLVFNADNKIVLGEINKRSKMQNVISLSCSSDNFLLICNTIIDKLKINSQIAQLTIRTTIDNKRTLSYNKSNFKEIITNFLDEFKFYLSQQSFFVLHREFEKNNLIDFSFEIERELIKEIKTEADLFNIKTIDFIELIINTYFDKLIK